MDLRIRRTMYPSGHSAENRAARKNRRFPLKIKDFLSLGGFTATHVPHAKDAHALKKDHFARCFNCRCPDGDVLQVAHKRPGKKEDPCKKDPRTLIYYRTAEGREDHAKEVLKQFNECGILCRACHDLYDAYDRYGPPHKRVDWSTSFKAHAHSDSSEFSGAAWRQWYYEYLTLSEDCELEIEDVAPLAA